MPRIPFIFPNKGLNDTVNFPSQSPDSSSDCNNVRVYDPIDKRKRGGSRTGLSKWNVSLVSGTNRVQSMVKSVEAAAIPGTDAEMTLCYKVPNTATGGFDFVAIDQDLTKILELAVTASSADGSIVRSAAGNYYVSGISINGTDKCAKYNSAGTEQWNNSIEGEDVPLAFDTLNSMLMVTGPTFNEIHGLQDSDGVRQWTHTVGAAEAAAAPNGMVSDDIGFVYLVAQSNSTYSGAGATKSVWKLDTSTGAIVQSFNIDADAATGIQIAIGPQNQILVTTSKETTTWDGQTTEPAANVFLLDPDLNYVNSTIVEPLWVVGGAILRFGSFASNGDIYIVMSSSEAVKLNRSTLAEIWSKTFKDPNNANVVLNSGFDQANEILWVSGTSTSTWIGISGQFEGARYNSNGEVIAGYDSDGSNMRWIFIRQGKGGLITRTTSLAIVADGDISLIEEGNKLVVASGTNALVTTDYTIQGASAFGDVFFVDGTNVKVLDVSARSVATWTATTAGTLPSLPRLIARWRGRIVLSGLVADPHNWFMSRLGDPYDWDYSPATTDAIQAVAGNVGEVGTVGDVVTALVPFDDDVLVIGMDQSIAKIAGDPAAGGSIDVITDDTGMAWDAWALDPNNQLYFMGIDGVYRMGRDSLPINITEDVLDGAFEAIDLTTNRVILEWDFRNKGLMVVIASINSTVTNEAFFFEARTGGWFPLSFPSAIGPDILLAYDAEEIDDKALLLGCRDGYIRKLDASTTDDDGTTITSNVRFFPISTRRGSDTRLNGIEIILAENSGDVTLKLYSGQTAEQVAISTDVRWSRTLKAGRNVLSLPRLSGNWLQIELAATTRWGLESVFGLFEEKGRSRRLKR